MKRIVTGAIFTAAICVLAYFALVYAEGYYLFDVFEAQPSEKIRLDAWINEFYEIALTTIITAFFGVLIWYLIGYYRYRISRWTQAKGFLAWLLIFIGTIVAVFVYGYYFTRPTEDLGKHLACLFYFINTGLIYWLSTAIFSPPAVKYVAPGSIRLRLARLGNLLVRQLG